MSWTDYRYVSTAIKRYENLIVDTSGYVVSDIAMFEYPTQIIEAIKKDNTVDLGYKIRLVSSIVKHLFYTSQPLWNRLRPEYEKFKTELCKLKRQT